MPILMIFVTVGSRNYPFNRLFKKLDELYEERLLTDSMFAQIGTSTYRPKHYEYKDFISAEEFLMKIQEADIVVSHGASGSIMKALNAKKKVIVVTRNMESISMIIKYRIMKHLVVINMFLWQI